MKSISASTAMVPSAHATLSWVKSTMIAQPVMPFKTQSNNSLTMRPPIPENSEMNHANNDGRYCTVCVNLASSRVYSLSHTNGAGARRPPPRALRVDQLVSQSWRRCSFLQCGTPSWLVSHLHP